MDDCIFCKIVKGDIPCHKIYENDLIIVILDAMPLCDGHTLVMPKAHYQTIFDMNESLAAEIMKVSWRVSNVLAKTLEAEGLNLVQNNNRVASQIIPHFHMHLIPRKSNDGLNIGSWAGIKATDERLQQIASQLKKAI